MCSQARRDVTSADAASAFHGFRFRQAAIETECFEYAAAKSHKEVIMKGRKGIRVLVFEESNRLGEVFSLYLTLRGYEPVLFSGLTRSVEESWRQGPMQSDRPPSDFAISALTFRFQPLPSS